MSCRALSEVRQLCEHWMLSSFSQRDVVKQPQPSLKKRPLRPSTTWTKKMSSWWLGFPPHTKGGLHPWKSCSMCLRIIIFLLHNVHAAASEAVASEAYGLFSQQKRRRCIYIYIVVNWTHAASSLVRGQWRHSSRTRTGTRPLQPLKPRD